MEAKFKQMEQNGLILMPFELVNKFINYAIKIRKADVRTGETVGNAKIVIFDGYIA